MACPISSKIRIELEMDERYVRELKEKSRFPKRLNTFRFEDGFEAFFMLLAQSIVLRLEVSTKIASYLSYDQAERIPPRIICRGAAYA